MFDVAIVETTDPACDADSAWAAIPAGLDAMRPGPRLAAVLASIDVRAVSGHDRIVVLRAIERMRSHYAARSYDTTAAVSEWMDATQPNAEYAFDATAAEVGAALHLTRRAAEGEVIHAVDLVGGLPQVWEAVAAGDLDPRRAWVIARGTVHLDPETRSRVVSRVMDAAPRLTTGQLRARLRRLCIDADPEDAAARYDHAVEERRVVTEPTVDGTANLLGLDLPPHRAAAAMRRLNRIARSLKVEGESRTMDQLRADVLLDLLEGTGRASRAGRGTVDIRVDLATLAQLAEASGDIGGYGPVVADIARQVTERQRDAEWRFTVIDPESGQPLQVGTTRRRPSAGQRRQIEARDATCVFPGCRIPAADCDLDHITPWAEIHRTSVDGLGPACRHHHRLKHHAGWSYRRLADGDYLWTSPLGHHYTTSGLPP